MKKILFVIVLCLSVLLAHSAMVVFRWNPDAYNGDMQVNGKPATHVKFYYGGQLKVYTNSVTVPLWTNRTLANYAGYDQYTCAPFTTTNYITIPIKGLKLNQQIFTKYVVVNASGEESHTIAEATCGFTVTNNSDGGIVIFPPQNLR